MTDTEQPSQWAQELFRKAVYEYGGESIPGEGEDLATALIQRAFAEREAELVGASRMVEAAMLRGGDGRVLDTGWNITKLNEARPFVCAALKSREAGHG